MIVVDIDGTIADQRHREHLLRPIVNIEKCREAECPFIVWRDQKPKAEPQCIRPATCEHKKIPQEQWDAFLDPELLMKDSVYYYSREVLESARLYHEVVFITGRGEQVREVTTLWLREVFKFNASINLYTRWSYQLDEPAEAFKFTALSSIKLAHGSGGQLYAFDDDVKVFDAYKQHGFKVFHAPGCWEQIHQYMGLFS